MNQLLRIQGGRPDPITSLPRSGVDERETLLPPRHLLPVADGRPGPGIMRAGELALHLAWAAQQSPAGVGTGELVFQGMRAGGGHLALGELAGAVLGEPAGLVLESLPLW